MSNKSLDDVYNTVQEATADARRPLTSIEQRRLLERQGVNPDAQAVRDAAQKAQNDHWDADVSKIQDRQGPAGRRAPRYHHGTRR
jgi:hypothetical protein